MNLCPIHALAGALLAIPFASTAQAGPLQREAHAATAADRLLCRDVGASVKREDGRPRLDADRLERVDFDEVEGTLWARGANYKMRFDERASFLPFLSSHAPDSYELAFSLRDLRCGPRSIGLARSVPAVRDERTVRFDRGPLSERYDLAPRSVEQSFVLDRPLGAGDVVVTLDLATELAATRDGAGWSFSNEYGSVRYGAAQAIDAAGRTLELATEISAQSISITVPAAFAARATYPLTIDPLIAAFGIEASPTESFAPDVCFDATGASVLYTWESEFNANDHDVWADMYAPSGAPLYKGGWIDMTSTYWGRPRCANNGATNRFLIVAHTLNNSTGRVEVWGRTRSVDVALISAQFKIAGGASFDLLDPDVGGDPYPTSPSYFLVAYERIYTYLVDHDINGKLVTDAGTLLTGTVSIDVSINTYDSVPSISKSNGSSNWNIAWQRASPAGGNDIFGARVAWNGPVSSPSFPIDVAPVDHTNPAASSSQEGSDLWVVAYEEDFGSDHDIIVSGLNAASVTRTINMSSYDGSFWYQDQRWPAVDCDGSHFVCTYAELYGQSAIDYDLYASELLFNSVSLSAIAAHQPIAAGYGPEFEGRIAAAESSHPAGNSRDFAITWHRQPDGYYFTSDDILGAQFQSTNGGAVVSFCDGASVACPCGNGSSTTGGCPNSVTPFGAHLTWGGTASTTNDSLQFFCSGMPPGVSCLFFQSFGALNGISGAPLGDGVRCVGNPTRRLAKNLASAAGGALYPTLGDAPLSVAGLVPPSGATVVYQVWYRNPAAFCTPSTTNLSNALVVAWTP